MGKKLSPRDEIFVREYLVDLDAQRAALAAGYSATVARTKAYLWVSNSKLKPLVYAAVQAAYQKRAEKLEVSAEWVLQRWIEIASADPNELIQYRRGCCRHCWGRSHAYQWTPAEYEAAAAEAKRLKKSAPKRIGGVDYDRTRPANPACPECRGEGIRRVYVPDTRTLTPEQRRLYAGVKLGKDGLQVLMRDQDAALENIARHLGMFKDKIELSGSIKTRTDEELNDRLAQLLGKA
jgi:phage terminase small subunit